MQTEGDILVAVDDDMAADGHGHQVIGKVVAEVGNSQDRQGIAAGFPFLDDVAEVIADKPQMLPLDHPVIAVLAVIGQRAEDQAPDFIEHFVAPEGGQQPVQVLHVNLDIFKKQDVPFPVVGGRVLAVKVIDESGQVAAERHARQPSFRRVGQPEHAMVGDRLVEQQRSHFLEIPRPQSQGGKVNRRNAGMVMNIVQQEGEIGKTHENWFAFFYDLVVFLVYLEQDIFGPGAPGHGNNQVGFSDGLLEDFGPVFEGGSHVVDEMVAGEEMGAELNVHLTQNLLQPADGLINQAFLAQGQTGRWGDKTDLSYLNPIHRGKYPYLAFG